MLFAYGTLGFGEVIEALLGRSIASIEARLPDHCCRPLRAAPYPVVVPSPGERCDGRLYDGITARDWRLLDRFEGELYRRAIARVVIGERSERKATLYLPRAELCTRLAPGRWTPERCRPSQRRRYAAIARALSHEREVRPSACGRSGR